MLLAFFSLFSPKSIATIALPPVDIIIETPNTKLITGYTIFVADKACAPT